MTALFFAHLAQCMRSPSIKSAAPVAAEIALTAALALMYFLLLSGGAL